MKTLKNLFLFAVLASVLLVSCKKDEKKPVESDQSALLVGKWEAKSEYYEYYEDDELVSSGNDIYEPNEMIIEASADGKVQITSEGVGIISGNYSVNGDVITLDLGAFGKQEGHYKVSGNTLELDLVQSTESMGIVYREETVMILERMD